jgi:hypothetical protein
MKGSVLKPLSRFAALLLVVVGTAHVAAQSRAPELSGPNLQKVLTFDSGAVASAMLSPNGRWVAFMAGNSLWMVSADGRGHAVRITSPGYVDKNPLWFFSSDALTFTSNRPSRNGENKFYGMTIAIDPNTGRASGPPRIVTTDEVFHVGRPSPDGKWIAYLTARGDSIKIVPSTGGTSRAVAKVPEGLATPPIWYADGKSIGFINPVRGPTANWYRVPASGGTPVPVERAPFNSALHLHGQLERPLKHAELRDSTERVVSTLDVPSGMAVHLFNYGSAALGIGNSTHTISHIYSVETGAHRVIENWADGWTGDGKNYVIELADGPEKAVAVGVQDKAGKIIGRTPLPADASGCCGWQGVVGSTLTYTRESSKALFAADAQSGRTRELTAAHYAYNTWAMPVFGRGGQGFSDGGRFLYATLAQEAIELRADDGDGNSTLLRAFSTKDSTWQLKYQNGGHGIAVAGDRIAWTDRTKDSITVWVARGPTGVPRHAATFASPQCTGNRRGPCHTELVWSERGDALALVTADDRPVVSVIHVRADGTAEGPPAMLQSGVRNPWCVRWVDGDRALAMIGGRTQGREDVVVVPVRAGSAIRVLTHGDASGEWMWVSPDGKEVLFPEVVTTGSSIWRLDFVPAPGAALTGKSKP